MFVCYETTFEGSHINGFKDALWLTIITFLTVGFGDFYPFSNFGWYIMIITVFGGLLYSALVIGLIHSIIMLTS